MLVLCFHRVVEKRLSTNQNPYFLIILFSKSSYHSPKFKYIYISAFTHPLVNNRFVDELVHILHFWSLLKQYKIIHGQTARLPAMWLWFDFGTMLYMLVAFVVGSRFFFRGYSTAGFCSGFRPSSTKPTSSNSTSQELRLRLMLLSL